MSTVNQLICSSGGNAGLSAAFIGKRLNIPVKVVVPTTTKLLMVEKIRKQNAEVTISGLCSD